MSGAARPEPICLIAPLGIDALLAVASSRHGPEGHYRLPKGGVYGDLDHDHLRDARVASEFLRVRHEFHAPDERLGAKDLATLRAIRHATQALARGREREYRCALERLLVDASFTLTADGALRPAARGWAGLATALLLSLAALRDARDHLKVCANPRCQWLFLDRSRNRSRMWCDPAACGNRLNVRRFRQRSRRSLARHVRPAVRPRARSVRKETRGIEDARPGPARSADATSRGARRRRA